MKPGSIQAVAFNILAALCGLSAIPATASASVTLGKTCAATSTSQLTAVQTATAAGVPSAKAPFGGVITSVSAIGYLGESHQERLKVFHQPDAMSPVVTVVANGPLVTFDPGLNDRAVQVPIAAGDLIGVWGVTGTLRCTGQPAENVIAHSSTELQPGQSTTGNTFTNVLLDLSAQLEPDADGDGFGDETQDQCASDKSTQGACAQPAAIDKVAPSLSFSGKTTQKLGSSVAVGVACNEACDLSASGNVSTASVNKSATYKLAGATAKLALGAKTTLKLKISKKKRKRIKRALRKGRRATANVTILAKDAAGNAATAKRKIKLRR